MHGSKICQYLDEAKTIKDVRKILQMYYRKIINSKDNFIIGLFLTINYKKPLQKLIRSYPQYIETCKYYLNKNMAKRCLIMASRYGRTKIVELLLEKGANIHFGNNQALRASIRSHTEIVKLLLDRGADIHSGQDAALFLACRYNCIDIVRLLLDRGADIHADNGITLRTAIIHNNIEIVKLILDREYSLNIYNKSLHLAADMGYTDIIKILLDKGADIHSDNDTALLNAFDNRCIKTINLLLDYGADITILKEENLQIDRDIVELLQNRGL